MLSRNWQQALLHTGTAQTLTFVLHYVKPPASVLEVGCGDGALARLLIDSGLKVTAIDKHADSIEVSRANGVEALEVNFLQYLPDMQFDAILFSRSLHHIQTPEQAVKHACTLLKNGGILLLEDFCAELMTQASALWFFGLKAVLAADGKPLKGRGPKLVDGQIPNDSLAAWNDHHFGKHSVADSARMRRAFGDCLKIRVDERVPYLYRYFLDDVEPAQGEQILGWEQALGKAGALALIGLRIVAQK